jgi:hypothetical protein
MGNQLSRHRTYQHFIPRQAPAVDLMHRLDGVLRFLLFCFFCFGYHRRSCQGVTPTEFAHRLTTHESKKGH